MHIPEETRPLGSKLQPRADEGHFIGYTESDKILQIYIPSKRKVVVSRQVTFPKSGEVEYTPPLIASEKTPTDEPSTITTDESDPQTKQSPPSHPATPEKAPTVPKTPPNMPGSFDEQLPPLPVTLSKYTIDITPPRQFSHVQIQPQEEIENLRRR